MPSVDLSPVARKFILHWGEMGTRWGINRTVAQIDALLFVSTRPLNAEEIAEILDVARSNVSTSLRELQSWNLVRVVHLMGDRRDYFEKSSKDAWENFRRVMDERKRREVDPTIELLRECVDEAKRSGAAERDVRERLGDLLEFFETSNGWYEQMRKLPNEAVRAFMRLGPKVQRMLRMSD